MITTNYGTDGRDVYKKPSFIQPAYSINGATTLSDKTAEPNHRFLFDVYINDEKVARVKSLASYLNYASVEISDILKNYVEDNFNHLTPRPSPDEDRQTNTQLYIVNSNYLEMKSVKILAGEEYKVNGSLTIFDGFDSVGEPAVYVSSWYSSYHAMDANSEEVLRAAGDLSNVQFSSNHLDVLERINKGMMNTAGYDGGSNYYETLSGSQYNTLYVNDNIKELSHRPLKRLRFEGIPQSASFYETNYITLWNKKSDNNNQNPANYDRATIGRNFFNDDEVVEPFGRIEPYNNYRQRIQTIGYEFYDPSGLLVDEVRYQPNSPVFDQPIYDTFGFDYEITGTGRFTGQGEGVSKSNQRRIETGWEYVKYNTFKEGSRVNITSNAYDGDFTYGGENIMFNVDGRFTPDGVKYMEGDKICDYRGPAELLTYRYTKYSTLDQSVLKNFVGFDTYNSFKDIQKLSTKNSVSGDSILPKASTFSCYAKAQYDNVEGFQGSIPPIGGTGQGQGPLLNTYSGSGQQGATPFQTTFTQAGFYRFTWEFFDIPDRFVLTYAAQGLPTDGDIIYDSGYMSDTGVFEFDNPNGLWLGMYIYRENSGTAWEYEVNIYEDPEWDPNLVIANLAQGNNFAILQDDEYDSALIVGLDATLPEEYDLTTTRYNFNLAPGAQVWNDTQQRFATYEEVKSLTGRSIEGINYTGGNGRSIIEVLTAKTIGQNISMDSGDDYEQLLMTFQINPVVNTATMDNFILFPGVYTGIGRATSLPTISSSRIYTKVWRIMNGNDKSLKNANQMKLKLYDFDNNFNLLKEEVGNAGKFTTNINGWGPSSSFPTGLVHTTLSDTQYFTYGVNGNLWNKDTGEGYGYLGNYQNQQKVGRGNMRNIPQAPTSGHIILSSEYQSYNQGMPAWYLSYMLSRETDTLVTPNQRIQGVVADSPSGKMFIHVSMMVYVKDNPELSTYPNYTNLYLFTPGPIGEPVELAPRFNVYRAEDKGRWKRMYYIAEVPNTDQDANFNYMTRVELRCDLFSNTDYDIWEMKDLIFGDVRVSYLFGETESDRVEESYKLYDRNLVQINGNQEPHLIESGDLLRNEAHSLFWLNKFGTWDDYRFRARSLKTTEVKRTTRSTGLDKLGTLNDTYVRGKQEFGDTINYSIDATDVYELTTDYVNQEEREWFENIFTSPKHMMYDELTDAFIRVNILNKKYTIINKKNQKLFQLKLEVQVSPEIRTLQVLGGY